MAMRRTAIDWMDVCAAGVLVRRGGREIRHPRSHLSARTLAASATLARRRCSRPPAAGRQAAPAARCAHAAIAVSARPAATSARPLKRRWADIAQITIDERDATMAARSGRSSPDLVHGSRQRGGGARRPLGSRAAAAHGAHDERGRRSRRAGHRTERRGAAGPQVTEQTARLRGWLEQVVERSASDLLLVPGAPPSLRVDGVVVPLLEGPLGGEEIEDAVDAGAGAARAPAVSRRPASPTDRSARRTSAASASTCTTSAAAPRRRSAVCRRRFRASPRSACRRRSKR